MITLDIDFAYDDTRTLFEFCAWWSGYDVSVVDYEAEGPAGGNPCITFRGSRDALRALVNDPWYGGDYRDHGVLL